jgi:hypothetical protein
MRAVHALVSKSFFQIKLRIKEYMVKGLKFLCKNANSKIYQPKGGK